MLFSEENMGMKMHSGKHWSPQSALSWQKEGHLESVLFASGIKNIKFQ